MSSPLQNRVLPTGEIAAIPQRGLFMGNRGGRIHREDRSLGRSRWKSRQWISCILDFKGRRREVMGQGYTELFFLDEVTALAAGHRPCFECRRTAAISFATAFPGEGRIPAPVMDACLHAQRTGTRNRAIPAELPDGAMVLIDGEPWARRADALLRWTPAGYDAARPLPRAPSAVLTPQATCSVLSNGYRPVWHPSATGVGT